MITCNHCGQENLVNAVACQKCGMQLSHKNDNKLKMDTQEPELPAWLESLRPGDRAVQPKNPAMFLADDLLDEGMLPSWMRLGRENVDDTMQSSASFSAPNTESGPFSMQGISASSFIDEQSLPSWMPQEGAESSKASQPYISGASLVQHDAAPEWMKTAPPAPDIRQTELVQPITPLVPSQGLSMRDLIDQQALPEWMVQQDRQNDEPSRTVPQARLAASSLLDMNALPSWIRESERGQEQPWQPVQPVQQPMQQQPWQPVQPVQQPMQQQQPWQPVQPVQQPMQQQQPWQPVQPVQQPMQQQQPWQIPNQPPIQTPSNNSVNGALPGNFSAASLIDMNLFPEGLGQQQALPENQAGPRQGVYGTPPNVENVRVPSRPRSEMGVSEDSEVAANVLSSMLGVASPFSTQGSQRESFQGTYQQGQGMNNNMGYQGNYQGPPVQARPAVTGEQKTTEKSAKRGLFDSIRSWLFRQ